MDKLIITRLFESFCELEKAIKLAKFSITSRDNPPAEIVERIATYEEILEKQRSLASELCSHVQTKNWDQVGRHIKLINAYSMMIRDDAREVMRGVQPSFTPAERELMLS